MATIYVVTSGCYSDYHLHAIFSTKGVAEKYVERMNGTVGERCDDYTIEEWELDGTNPGWLDGTLGCWEIRMAYETADVLTVRQLGAAIDEGITPVEAYRYRGKEQPPTFEIVVYADTQERAVKVAMERRAIWLANLQEPA